MRCKFREVVVHVSYICTPTCTCTFTSMYVAVFLFFLHWFVTRCFFYTGLSWKPRPEHMEASLFTPLLRLRASGAVRAAGGDVIDAALRGPEV